MVHSALNDHFSGSSFAVIVRLLQAFLLSWLLVAWLESTVDCFVLCVEVFMNTDRPLSQVPDAEADSKRSSFKGI